MCPKDLGLIMSFNNLQSYLKKTIVSRAWYERACRVFPGGVSHNIRFFHPYPFFVEKAKGRHLYDVDGNTYTDYWMGHWALILGHSPKHIVTSLFEQVQEGTLFGTTNNVSVLLAEQIQKVVSPADLMRFCSTGSEATMYATRLARAYSKKRIIVKSVGGWHGFNTNLMHSVNYPFETTEGLGLNDLEGEFLKSIPFNDLEVSINILEAIKDDLACIIIEPVLGAGGAIPGEKDFLYGLQEYAKRNNILWVIDEIVTGFRLHYGTLSALNNLQPDLITLGKIVGGGFPIGVVSGLKEIMSLADPVLNKDKRERCFIGGGTFSSNPVSMKAGLLTMEFLKKNKENIYGSINSLGNEFRQRLKRIFADSGIRVDVTGIGSLFQVHFLNDSINQIRNVVDAAAADQEKLLNYHCRLISDYGIFNLPRKMAAVSYAHNKSDLEALLSATEDLINRGIFDRNPPDRT
jgi:glutamate-1-semialdehyde 2,1-aminomutase